MMRVGVGGRVEAEDNMVDRDAQVESAFGVEVDDLIGGYRRDFLVYVTEGTAVSHRLNVETGRLIEPEETPDADPVQSVPLSSRVLSRIAPGSVHDGLRDEEAVDDMTIQCLVGIQVVALAHAQGQVFLGDEVEVRVDLVLTVREEKFHR
jgi:hypothetical protein